MKNSLAENMLRFGTKNLSKNEKRILEQINEGGGNPNKFLKLILYIPTGAPGGNYANFVNKMIPGKLARFELQMLTNAKISSNPLNRYFSQFKKYPIIKEIQLNLDTITQTDQISIKAFNVKGITGTFGLVGNEAIKDSKTLQATQTFINNNMNKEFINPSVQSPMGSTDGGAHVTFMFPDKFLNESEYPEQQPETIQIISRPI